uniref:Uncharacterized protein n=1 Tax=Cannabis sativa TaxID=3483 RepID=A0A803QHF0_CANSA
MSPLNPFDIYMITGSREFSNYYSSSSSSDDYGDILSGTLKCFLAVRLVLPRVVRRRPPQWKLLLGQTLVSKRIKKTTGKKLALTKHSIEPEKITANSSVLVAVLKARSPARSTLHKIGAISKPFSKKSEI